ncbi:PDZ domain-containing protein, partial [Oceanospirillum sp. HFRX-1_2]
AHLAGMQPGDIITQVEGEAVVSGRGTMNQIAQKRPGEKISITIFRDGKSLTLQAEVGRRPTPPQG